MSTDRVATDEASTSEEACVEDRRIVDPTRLGLVSAVAGFDVVGWNRQAEATGGDFFDFQEVSGGALALIVADVCGRGAAAAAVADQCRDAFHRSLEFTEDPTQVAERVNQLLFAGRAPERFVTAFFGRLERNEHRLSYVSAGHGPVWFYSKSQGSLRELETHGFPLALEVDEVFRSASVVSLEPGDFVAIVTDGFYEWIDINGDGFGTERLSAEILRNRDGTAAEIIRGMHRELLAFTSGVPQVDDLTAVVIKRIV